MLRNAKSESIPKMNSPATRHTTTTTIVLFVVLFGVGHTTFLNSALQSLKYFTIPFLGFFADAAFLDLSLSFDF